MAAAMADAAAIPADLRKRIEIMAEHIARNGPEFEATVRQKNTSNPQFAFLFSGQGSEYYKHVLASHRNPAPSAPSTAPAPSACPSAGTATWSNGSGGAYSAAVVEGLKALRRRWPEPPVFQLGPDAATKLAEIIDSLQSLASRDAIRTGRIWIEANAALGQQIAGSIMKWISDLPACSHKLHVLYLVHDLLQTEAARKDPSQPLIKVFKPYLVWMLRPAYQPCATEEEGSRVLRLLELWVERSILTSKETDEIRSLVTPAELPPPEREPVAVVPPVATESVRQQLQSQMQRSQQVQPRPPPRPLLPRPPAAGVAGYAAKAGTGMVPGVRPSSPLAPGMVRPPYGLAPASHAVSRPSLAAYSAAAQRPQGFARQQGASTPETVPVGVMATMLLGVKRHKKATRANFVPYVPLEGAQTPQGLPPMASPTPSLLERVEDFYQDVREDERSSSSSSSSSRRSRRRSRSRSPGRSSRGVWASGTTAAPSHGAVPPPML